MIPPHPYPPPAPGACVAPGASHEEKGMRLDKTESEFKRLCDLYHINAAGLASVLDLEFLPASQPEAEESWPARLEVRCSVPDLSGLIYVELLVPGEGWLTTWLNAEEAARLRELVARYNALENILAHDEGLIHVDHIKRVLGWEREKVKP